MNLINEMLYNKSSECLFVSPVIKKELEDCSNSLIVINDSLSPSESSIKADPDPTVEDAHKFLDFYKEEIIIQEIAEEVITNVNNSSEQDVYKFDHFEEKLNTSNICDIHEEPEKNSSELQSSIEHHNKYELELPHECMTCNEVLPNRISLLDHVGKYHTDDEQPSFHNAASNKYVDNLEEEYKPQLDSILNDETQKLFACSLCNKIFYSLSKLKKHMLTHQDRITISLEVKKNSNRQTNNRRTKQKVPSPFIVKDASNGSITKLFPCDMCNKIFSSRSSQQIHVRVHTGERPYGCHYCWKAFADGGTLRKHERIHTGEKPYVCPICTKAFNQRVVLREHIKTHHVGSELQCDVCSMVCSSANDLCHHLVKHSDENTAKHRTHLGGKPRKYKRRNKRVLRYYYSVTDMMPNTASASENSNEIVLTNELAATVSDNDSLLSADSSSSDIVVKSENNEKRCESPYFVDLPCDYADRDSSREIMLESSSSSNKVLLCKDLSSRSEESIYNGFGGDYYVNSPDTRDASNSVAIVDSSRNSSHGNNENIIISWEDDNENENDKVKKESGSISDSGMRNFGCSGSRNRNVYFNFDSGKEAFDDEKSRDGIEHFKFNHGEDDSKIRSTIRLDNSNYDTLVDLGLGLGAMIELTGDDLKL